VAGVVVSYWPMLSYPDIDPVMLELGPLRIHWYGFMYLAGFSVSWLLMRWRSHRLGLQEDRQQIDDLLFYGALGVILGGRMGYVLFYGMSQFLEDPLYLFRIWDGGMSFHGGLLGVLLAMWLFGRRIGCRFFEVTDFIAPMVPVGLLAGRIGNFINGELWGKAGDVPWAIQVPCARFPDACAGATGAFSLPLHPSQLYEAGLEGLLLFLILWLYSSRPRPLMAVSGLFLLGYGAFRFAVEFVRTPDAHLGYLAFDWFTMGQLLTLPMLVAGAVLISMAYMREKQA
jgi:phosphatidylglycerol---prolipoprotein diacylglyceryl transferase